ncbi:MAG: hypothetical protein HY722_12350 [Planctomycetes bacterium]|nr:hypothetical protein [Planctomycetota bacterium]
MNILAVAAVTIVVQFALLYILCVSLARMQMRIHRRWYMLNAVLGTAVHESSHATGCLLTRTPIREWKLFSPQPDGTLGWVTHDQAGRVATAIISVAPIFGNTLVLYLLARFVFPEFLAGFGQPFQVVGISDVSSAVEVARAHGATYVDYLTHLWGRVVGEQAWRDWRTWTFFFLAMSIGSHAAPSKPDLKHFFGAFVPVLAVLAAAVWGLVHLEVPMDWATRYLLAGCRAMAFVSSIGIVFSLLGLGLNLALWLPLKALGLAAR